MKNIIRNDSKTNNIHLCSIYEYNILDTLSRVYINILINTHIYFEYNTWISIEICSYNKFTSILRSLLN